MLKLNLSKYLSSLLLCILLVGCSSLKDSSQKSTLLAIGLMSGTSMDGIDAALIQTNGTDEAKSVNTASLDYEPEFKILLRTAEYNVRKNKGDIKQAKENFPRDLKEFLEKTYKNQKQENEKLALYLYKNSNKQIELQDIIDHSSLLHAKLVNQLISISKLKSKNIDVIGYHGQTLYHNPQARITVQVGNGNLLSSDTGIKVVSDFRSNDIKNNGNGAPLAPIYHQMLAIKHNLLPACFVNLGGIANITVINGKNWNNIVAFDTGPANVLIDQYMREKTYGKEFIDKNGKYGQKGKVNESLFADLKEHSVIQNEKNYLDLSPPKSLDSKDFRLPKKIFKLSVEDACATLEAFTAFTVADAVEKYIKPPLPNKFIISGGGAYNPVIIEKLHEYLKPILGTDFEILKADNIENLSGKYMEAELFAYLAVRSLYNLPISFPLTTGVKKPTIGGVISNPSF